MQTTKSVIKSIKFVNGWRGNEETLYFHEITFENGHQGKLDGNNQQRPDWLYEDNEIFYSITEGRNGARIKFLGVASGRQAANSIQSTQIQTTAPIPQTHQHQRYIPQNNDKKNKYSNDPEWRETQQKCISMTTCLDRANELVIAGKIELKAKYDNALEDFNFIIKHAGIDAAAKFNNNTISNTQPVPQNDTQSNPVSPAQNISQPALFENEDAPVSEFISQSLLRCKNKKQLDNLKSQLTEEEKQNKNVIVAFYSCEQSLKKNNAKK